MKSLWAQREGSLPRLSGLGRRKETKSPPRLSLGIIYVAPFVEGLILLLEYGFSVYVRPGKVLGTQDRRPVGRLPFIVKGIFNILILDSHTH